MMCFVAYWKVAETISKLDRLHKHLLVADSAKLAFRSETGGDHRD